MHVEPADLGPGVGAWFTGRGAGPDPPVGRAGNLSHRRPHRPPDLAATRRRVGEATSTDPRAWHLMEQRHGTRVALVDGTTPSGAELRGVDAAVTTVPGRPLVVLAADCVPVLLAGDGLVAVVHAGRRGLAAGVVAAALRRIEELGRPTTSIRALLGPAIGACCYEVPPALRDEVAGVVPGTAATTTRGTASLDLPAGVVSQLEDAGVRVASSSACVRCDDRFFSHRRDPGTGRQAGLVVLREAATGGGPR